MRVSGIIATQTRTNPQTGTDVIGAFVSITTFGFPVAPKMVGFYQIEFDLEETLVEHEFTLSVRMPSGDTVPLTKQRMSFPNAEGQRTLTDLTMSVPSNFSIKTAGFFDLLLFCDDILVSTLPFRIKEADASEEYIDHTH